MINAKNVGFVIAFLASERATRRRSIGSKLSWPQREINLQDSDGWGKLYVIAYLIFQFYKKGFLKKGFEKGIITPFFIRLSVL